VELEPSSGTNIGFQVTDGRVTGLEWREIRFTKVP
jgi:hypothetical protein